ncbi:MAG: L,D-transpeptidase family protein [Hyphomicrobiaceae bacterium]
MLALIAVGLIGAGIWWATYDRDRRAIVAERAKRLALSKLGRTLPGTPNLEDLDGRLAAKGLKSGAPVFIRIFKREFELELWLKHEGRFVHFATYPVCRWSGQLGPKLIEGDGQSPEGFYTVDKRALNPHSRWHRSFNLGFPNVFDRAHGRTGSYLMVHGGCSSVGCYAMTNAVVDEIWGLVTAALRQGQKRIHVHAFPFRMSDENLRAREGSEWSTFWSELKPAYDAFETSRLPPRVTVCRGRYQVVSAESESEGEQGVTEGCMTSAQASKADG